MKSKAWDRLKAAKEIGRIEELKVWNQKGKEIYYEKV